MHIRNLRGNRLKRRTKPARQAHDRALQIIRRSRIADPNYMLCAWLSPQQTSEGRLHLQDDSSAALVDQGGIAEELNRVAGPLLAMQQDSPAVKFRAIP